MTYFFKGGFTFRGSYIGSTVYYPDNVVEYDGSGYVALQTVQGVLPTDDTFWGLLVAEGDPGTNGTNGVIQTIVAGVGISVDDTDPANPIISVVDVGIPTGGTTGQVLGKASGDDYDVSWVTAGTGDVSGPASAVDNQLARYDGTTGKLIQASGVLVDDSGNLLVTTSGAQVTIGANNWNLKDNGSSSFGIRISTSFYHTFVASTSATNVFTGGLGFGNTNASPHIILTAPAARQIRFGGASATPGDYSLEGMAGSGTNIAGASVAISGGVATGNATPGVLNLQTSEPGSSGTTQQTKTTRVSISHLLVTSSLPIITPSLRLKDTDLSHNLLISANSNLTADRALTITSGDAARDLKFLGNGVVGEVRGIRVKISGNGSAITTGLKEFTDITYDCDIIGWRIFADQVGDVVVDVWKDTLANFPPVVGDTIAGSEKPTLSSAQTAEDLSLTTWSGTLNAGDILAWNVDSASTVETIWITLFVRLR